MRALGERLGRQPSPDELDDVTNDFNIESVELTAWRESHFTRKLLKKARRFRVETPSRWSGDSQYWSQSRFGEDRHLTEAGIALVREKIREEERWRVEKRASWVTWITALAGVIGATTGLVAVLLSLS